MSVREWGENMGYIIVGDTASFKGCLVTVINGSRSFAEKRLEQMLYAPTENDLLLMKGHKNLRIEETESKDEWWNDPFLAN